MRLTILLILAVSVSLQIVLAVYLGRAFDRITTLGRNTQTLAREIDYLNGAPRR